MCYGDVMPQMIRAEREAARTVLEKYKLLEEAVPDARAALSHTKAPAPRTPGKPRASEERGRGRQPRRERDPLAEESEAASRPKQRQPSAAQVEKRYKELAQRWHGWDQQETEEFYQLCQKRGVDLKRIPGNTPVAQGPAVDRIQAAA